MSQQSPRYLIVIPAYNEAATIEQVVSTGAEYADVCVVDDSSIDATPRILAKLDYVHSIRHKKNTHIAGAILDGMKYAQQAGYDYVITMDAGLSHDPAAIPSFQARAGADLVIGYRERRIDVPLFRKALSGSANYLCNLAMKKRFLPWGGAGLRDATSGFRMYSRAAYSLLLRSPLRSRSFDFHLEALTYIYRGGLTIAEVPITYVFTNSSLRWKVLAESAFTCARLWLSSPPAVPATVSSESRDVS